MPINPGKRRQTVNFLSVTHEARWKNRRRREGKRDATLPPTVTRRTVGSPLVPEINTGQEGQENISEGPWEPHVLTGSRIPKAASGLPSPDPLQGCGQGRTAMRHSPVSEAQHRSGCPGVPRHPSQGVLLHPKHLQSGLTVNANK